MMIKQKVTIIDYSMGNIFSVVSAFNYLGSEVEVVADPDKISKASILVLPGVGSFRSAMDFLKMRNIDEAIIDNVRNKGAKILGICLGMQLLGSHSTEDGQTEGLNLLSNKIERFTPNEVLGRKVPHVGFNSLQISEKKSLFKDLPDSPDFYFTHSYRMLLENLEARNATCNYGVEFLAAYEIGNICGTQFHPEKSQTNGLILLKNFLKL